MGACRCEGQDPQLPGGLTTHFSKEQVQVWMKYRNCQHKPLRKPQPNRSD